MKYRNFVYAMAGLIIGLMKMIKAMRSRPHFQREKMRKLNFPCAGTGNFRPRGGTLQVIRQLGQKNFFGIVLKKMPATRSPGRNFLRNLLQGCANFHWAPRPDHLNMACGHQLGDRPPVA